MPSVYLLTDGSYSDYHIVAAFSTEEKARLAMEFIGGGIEEFELDADLPSLEDLKTRGLFRFEVSMDWEGNTRSVTRLLGAYSAKDCLSERLTCYPLGWHPPNMAWAETHRYGLLANVLAHDEKHAVKIVNEWRSQAIAENVHLKAEMFVRLKGD